MSSSISSDTQILKVDTLKRVRVPKARREALLDEFQRSGLSGAAFAKRHGIKYSTFAAWARKRRVNPAPQEVPPLSLAEIVVNETRPSSWPQETSLRLHLPGGAWLELNGSADGFEQAAQLIRALEA